MPPFNEPQLDISAKKTLKDNVIYVVSYSLPGTSAATAGNYGNMFVSDKGYTLVGVSVVFRVASTSGTLNIEKCGSGVAPGSGTTLLDSTISLSGTANTPVHGTLTRVKSNLIIRRGDRLVALDAGTLTSQEDLNITLYLKEI